MNAERVLAQLAEKYVKCTAYRDQGFLYSWRESVVKTDKPQIVFTTYFEQPNKIRFEWLNDHSKNLLWCDGVDSYSCRDSYDSGPEKESCESPEMAVAGHTGISRRTAFMVPSLLLEEMRVGARWCLLRSDIKFIGMDIIENQDCYCIQGSNNSPNDTTIWVSTDNFSLRRHKQYMDKSAIPPGPKIRLTAQELSPGDQRAEGNSDSILISIHRPPNLITRREVRDFMNLFQGTKKLVDEAVYGPGNYYEEITYEESEFETHISPNIFSGIRRDEA